MKLAVTSTIVALIISFGAAAHANKMREVRSKLVEIQAQVNALRTGTPAERTTARTKLQNEVESRLTVLEQLTARVGTENDDHNDVGAALRSERDAIDTSITNMRNKCVSTRALNIDTQAGMWSSAVGEIKGRYLTDLTTKVNALGTAIRAKRDEIKRLAADANRVLEEHERTLATEKRELETLKREMDRTEALLDALAGRFNEALDDRDDSALADLERQIADVNDDYQAQTREFAGATRQYVVKAGLAKDKLDDTKAYPATVRRWEAIAD